MAEAGGSGLHEAAGVRSGVVTVVAVAFLLSILLALAIVGGMFRLAGRPIEVAPPQPPPASRLQIDPAADLDMLQAQWDRTLAGYAWVDRDAGLVRIPIERAMAIVAARGDKAYEHWEPAAGSGGARR